MTSATGQAVALTFHGVRVVSSSFINGAFISLLDTSPVAAMRQPLRIVDSSRGINAMIRDQVKNSSQKSNTKIRDQVRNNSTKINTEIRDQARSVATQQPNPPPA